MNSDSLEKKYFDLTNLIQQEFERNILKYGDKIKCQKGCSKCCHRVFKITEFDSFIIKKYFESFADENISSLKNKALSYLELLKKTDDKELTAYIPCPALGHNGECLIYDCRPVICRRFGPPIYDYKNPSMIFSCDLNFSEGEEIIDDELIPNQTLIGKTWDSLKTDFNNEMNLKKNASTTIAEAILNA